MAIAQGGAVRRFTYQFELPVTSLFIAGLGTGQFSQLALDNDVTRTGFFRIFVDTDISLAGGSPDPNTGTGYGDVANSGLKQILAGVVRLNSAFSILQTQPSTTLSSLGTEPGGIGKTVSTTQLQGTAALDIDVKADQTGAAPPPPDVVCTGLTDTNCVDTGYFIGDLSSLVLTLGIATTADATIPTFGLNAPFGPGNPASSSIVGVAGTFGDAQTHTQTVLPSNTGSVPVVVSQPINDFVCNVHTVLAGPIIIDSPGPGPCDVQLASAGNMFVNHEIIPEPGSLALLAIGLGAVGFSARRRRKLAVA
jgi:hypothetical protein